MNHNYSKVIGCLLLSLSGYSLSIAQSTGPDFLGCSSTPDSLCVQTEGVRLPANNQLYLGEGHPDATSCSVHVTQKKLVVSTCGGSLQYEVHLFLNDTSTAYILKPLTTITADSKGMAELYFNTEESPDVQISSSGIPYTSGCMNYHRIKWIVTDTCGIESVCEQLVDLYDCSKLAPENSSSTFSVQIPAGCQLTLYAEDFYLGGVDDCRLQDQLTFSFEEEKYNPYITVTCPEAIGIELTWKIWIADAGRDLNCDGQIDWNEKNRIDHPFQIKFSVPGHCECGMPPDPRIEGTIQTEHGAGISDVLVELSTPGQVYPTYVTGADGKYFFLVEGINGEATITAKRNDFHKNGVSTLDLVIIHKHLLGKELFNSPYQFIIADANNSQNVSSIDLIELRKLILGIYTELPSNQSWRFVRKDFIFTDTMNPWPLVDANTIIITDIEHPGNTDFIGVKVGDINGTALPHFGSIIPRESLKPYNLLTGQVAFNIGETINVPISISSSQRLTGFQFTLNANGMEILDVVPGSIPLTDGEYALFGDKMTVSWFNERNVDVSADEILFTLVMRAKQAGNLSQSLSINSDITEAEIYLDDEQTFVPVLQVVNPIAEAELVIASCAPNPWKDESTVFFYLPESSNVTYNVIDVNGRKIFSESEFLKEGFHSYTLKASDFSLRGMVILEIGSGKISVVQKMVVLE